MEYIYATLILDALEKEVTEENLKRIIEAAGAGAILDMPQHVPGRTAVDSHPSNLRHAPVFTSGGLQPGWGRMEGCRSGHATRYFCR